MRKRGSSQVDWAISLAMFLLYIAWFFILAKPNFDQQTDIGGLADYVADRIIENTTWTVHKIPVFMDANVSDSHQPVIIDFPFGWDNGTFGFSPEMYFMYDSDRLYTTYTTDGNPFTLFLIHSDSTYTKPFFSKDLEAAESSVRITEDDFEMLVDNGLIQEITYRDVRRVRNFSLYSNGVELNITNSSYLAGPVASRHLTRTDVLNQTMLVFTEHPNIFLQFSMASALDHTITLEFILDDFPYYYMNTDSWGAFNYSKYECMNDSSPFVDVYSSLSGMTLISEKNMDISLCTTNSSLLMNASISTDEDFETAISFHTGTYLNALNFSRPSHTGTGLAQKLNGMNSTKLANLVSLDYDTLKEVIDFPQNTEFSFWILNSSRDAVYSYVDSAPLETDTVLARERKTFMLDQDGNLEPYTIRVRVW